MGRLREKKVIYTSKMLRPCFSPCVLYFVCNLIGPNNCCGANPRLTQDEKKPLFFFALSLVAAPLLSKGDRTWNFPLWLSQASILWSVRGHNIQRKHNQQHQWTYCNNKNEAFRGWVRFSRLTPTITLGKAARPVAFNLKSIKVIQSSSGEWNEGAEWTIKVKYLVCFEKKKVKPFFNNSRATRHFKKKSLAAINKFNYNVN